MTPRTSPFGRRSTLLAVSMLFASVSARAGEPTDLAGRWSTALSAVGPIAGAGVLLSDTIPWIADRNPCSGDEFEVRACRSELPTFRKLVENGFRNRSWDVPLKIKASRYDFQTRRLVVAMDPVWQNEATHISTRLYQVVLSTVIPRVEANDFGREELVSRLPSVDIPMAEAEAKAAPLRLEPGAASALARVQIMSVGRQHLRDALGNGRWEGYAVARVHGVRITDGTGVVRHEDSALRDGPTGLVRHE